MSESIAHSRQTCTHTQTYINFSLILTLKTYIGVGSLDLNFQHSEVTFQNDFFSLSQPRTPHSHQHLPGAGLWLQGHTGAGGMWG